MKTIYLYTNDGKVRKSGERLLFTRQNKVVINEPIRAINSIVLFSNTQLTTQVIKFCLEHQVNITYCLRSGRILGYLNAFSEQQSILRLKQYEKSKDQSFCLDFAKEILKKKTAYQIDFIKMKRNKSFNTKKNIKQMDFLQKKIDTCKTKEQIMGIEGRIASLYFVEYGIWLTGKKLIRSKHPSYDYINALLNLTYSLICSRIITELVLRGFDISIGFLHSIKSGRPSLACDFLELYRSKCDHFILNLIHRKEIKETDFERDKPNGFYLTKDGFQKYIEKYSAAFQNSFETGILDESMYNILKNN